MDWNAIGAIAGVVSAIGTISALLFVFWQLRNVVKSQSAAAVQSIVDGERELWQTALSDENMTAALALHFGLDKEFLEQLGITDRMALQMLLFFRQYENLYYQHHHGILQSNVWSHWVESMVYTFKDPRCRQLFERAKVSYTGDFEGFVREKIFGEATT